MKRAQLPRTTLEKKETTKKSWFLVDAKGKTLGRLCSEIVKVLRGKHTVTFTPHVDCGDGVVVVNARHIRLSGAKPAQKVYKKYTGFPGGYVETPFSEMINRHPARVITRAVTGMMPKTKLARKQLKGLRVFADETHSMHAQQPKHVAI